MSVANFVKVTAIGQAISLSLAKGGLMMMSSLIVAIVISGCDDPMAKPSHSARDTQSPAPGESDDPKPVAEPPPDLIPSFEGNDVSAKYYTVGIRIGQLVLPAASGGDGTLTYTLEPTPEGLTFDVATRTLTGTPTAENLYGVTYTVQDADGDQASRKFLITVAPTASYCSPGEFTDTAGARWMIGDWDTSRPTSGDQEVGNTGRTVLFVDDLLSFLRDPFFADGGDMFFADTYGYSWDNEGASDDRKECQTQASGLYAVEYKGDRAASQSGAIPWGIKIAIRSFDACRIWYYRERPNFAARFILLESTNPGKRPSCPTDG